MKTVALNFQEISNLKIRISIFFTLLLIIGLQSTFAQEFDTTDDYFVSFQGQLNDEGEALQSAILMTKENSPKEITSFPIIDTEMINGITISRMKNPGLHGVKSVIKVEVQYIEYCAYNVANYILETEKGGYVSLPMLTNEDCNDNPNEMVYLFPSQKFGEANKILTSQVSFSSNGTINAEKEDSFVWNDDNYGTSGKLYGDI